MSRIRKFTRRSFLVSSAAMAGGVAFGVYRAKRDLPNPLLRDLPADAASFNPWVLITPERVTLIAPHMDSGQGVWTMQAALIAEELDIDLEQVMISFGTPGSAYYNTAMPGEMVPIKAFNESQMAEFARAFAAGAMKAALPTMMTGGSTSTADSFDKLRQAGAVARETLKAAAALQTGIRVQDLRTAKGTVILPDDSALPYTQLASTAATLEPVRDVTLKAPEAWRILGKSFKRADMAEKVTGTLRYGIDQQVEGMVYAAVRLNPRKSGSAKNIDASRARSMRGVMAVLPLSNGVAVIADNTWRAFQAAEALELEWEDAAYPKDQEDHWRVLSDSFVRRNLNGNARNDGDVETAIAGNETLLAEYRSPYVAHAPMEPLNATVRVTDTGVDVWTSTQVQMFAVQAIASITGHSAEDVHLHAQFAGGSFGHRLELDFIRQAAEIANQMPGIPVKLTYSREEEFAQEFPRAITMGRGQGAVAGGKVVALDLQLAAPSVTDSQISRLGFDISVPDLQLHAGAWDNPYLNLPNLRVRSYKAKGLAPVSSWRSVGAAANGFAFDSLLDELIHLAGADPLHERIRLMGHAASRKVLEAVGEMSAWGSPLAPGKGRGVAFVYSFGVPTAEVVEVTNTSAGIRIDKVWVACDVGTVVDPLNFENQVQGGVVFGLGHAINSQITFADGKIEQQNYYDAEGMRLYQCPEIFVRGLENGSKTRGVGEPPVPPAAPALANAIFAATGRRIREMPFAKHIDFV